MNRLFRRHPRHQAAPPGAYAVQAAEVLLNQHRGLLQELRRLVGLPSIHYETLYQPLLENYAAVCQALPASEAHHHCAPGGLLEHGLEVVLHAVKIRRKKLLPAGATAEELAAKQDRWTYACASGALLHDVGKPVTDLVVEMYETDGRYMGDWQPWRGPLEQQGCAYYRMRHRRDRQHGLHERIPAFVAHLLMPRTGLEWLAEDLDVLAQWSATLVGNWDAALDIGEIVQTADSRSVAANLAGEHQQLPSARQKPLHERLLTGLRYLLDQGEMPLNARGAAGWIFDDHLWLVSKRVLDQLRDHLEREGHAGIPQRNDRLMDTLQQTGCLKPNGDKAIWTIRVMADDWPKAVELTTLCFPLNRIWPDPTAAPAAFKGQVEIIGASGDESESETETQAAPKEANTTSTTCSDQEITRQDEATSAEPEAQPVNTGLEQAPEIRQAPESTAVPQQESPSLEKSGERFLTWLRNGFASGAMEVNSVAARIHRVQDGVLLVSPGVFKDYRDPHPESNWQQVQRRFSRLKVHRKCADGTNIHSYDVVGQKNRKRSVVKGYLIGNDQLDQVFPGIALPNVNPHLKNKA